MSSSARRVRPWMAWPVLLCCLAVSVGAQQEFQLVLNKANPETVLDVKQVSDFFLKKDHRWEDGTPAEPVDQVSPSVVREAFSVAVHGRSAAAIKSFWAQQIYSGRGTPPVELADDAAVLRFVQEHPGGVGYISPETPAVGVKLVSLLAPPVRIHVTEPRYSRAAIAARVSGVVELRIAVDTDGNVGDVTVLQGLGLGLTEEAVRAVREWKYRPAMIDGVPVPIEIEVSVKFSR